MIYKNTEIKVVRADITTLDVDAIVNAANNKLIMGGGVAAAIKKKGGKIIEEEAMKLGPVKIGEAVAGGAGSLQAKYVIHAATMGLDHQTDETKIRDSAKNALKVAEGLKIRSIAFPALGCGVGGFPLLAGAKIMAQEVMKHLRERKSSLKEIIFCLYDEKAYGVFNKGVTGYIEYMSEKLHSGPFSTVDAIIQIPASPAGGNGGIVIIKRKNPPFGWALPGGFVDYGESLEAAVKREAREETGLELNELKQFHTYSEPGRDPRFHTIATVFIAEASGQPRAADDAEDLKIIKSDEIDKFVFVFDHKSIIEDYIRNKT